MNHKCSNWAFRLTAVVLLVPVLYFFGLGPACCLFWRGDISEEALSALYDPLIQRAGDNPIGWYMDWWYESAGDVISE